MENVYTKELLIPASAADHTARLGHYNTFALFMDVASEHAEMLGVGYRAMIAKDLFWLTVRTKIRFFERPHITDPVLVRTWPEKPGKIRSIRSYELWQDGRLLIAGKTEWAVLNVQKQSIVPMAGIFPEGFDFREGTALDAPFIRVGDDFDGQEVYSEYAIRSTDIDIGGHMNNVAYVRAAVGGFSLAERDALDFAEMDVMFKRPCFEGEKLSLQKRNAEEGLDIRISKGGETVFLARFI